MFCFLLPIVTSKISEFVQSMPTYVMFETMPSCPSEKTIYSP